MTEPVIPPGDAAQADHAAGTLVEPSKARMAAAFMLPGVAWWWRWYADEADRILAAPDGHADR